jgi:hypothetical protein
MAFVDDAWFIGFILSSHDRLQLGGADLLIDGCEALIAFPSHPALFVKEMTRKDQGMG